MYKIIGSLLVMTALCGCTTMKKTLGIEKNSPDEMMVVSRAPLSIPPEFNLRPVVVDSEGADDKPVLSSGEQSIIERMK